jgi:hypothetical protein
MEDSFCQLAILELRMLSRRSVNIVSFVPLRVGEGRFTSMKRQKEVGEKEPFIERGETGTALVATEGGWEGRLGCG